MEEGRRDIQSLQLPDHLLDFGGVFPERGTIFLDVEDNVFVVEVPWVRTIVRDEGEVEKLSRSPLGGEVAKGKLNDGESGGPQTVFDCGGQIVGDHLHAIRKEGLSARFEETLRDLSEREHWRMTGNLP